MKLTSVEAVDALPSQCRRVLQATADDTDDEAVVKEKMEKALAEHVARHPEDVGRTVEDFDWILQVIVGSWPIPGTQEWRDAWDAGRHPAASEEAAAAWTSCAREVLAEHVARHPEDAGRRVADFSWMVSEIVSRVKSLPSLARN